MKKPPLICKIQNKSDVITSKIKLLHHHTPNDLSFIELLILKTTDLKTKERQMGDLYDKDPFLLGKSSYQTKYTQINQINQSLFLFLTVVNISYLIPLEPI